MKITLDRVSKRYTDHWIIRNLSYRFEGDAPYALLGSNGSGKSTLLKMISGYLSPSKGSIAYDHHGHTIRPSDIYKHISFAAPYVSPLRSLTIEQMLEFYTQFKKLRNGLNKAQAFDAMSLSLSWKSYISDLSSGQEQRVRLTLALLADTPILLLDEPGSYLDENSKVWFQDLLKSHISDRVSIIASNDSADLVHTVHQLQVEDFK